MLVVNIMQNHTMVKIRNTYSSQYCNYKNQENLWHLFQHAEDIDIMCLTMSFKVHIMNVSQEDKKRLISQGAHIAAYRIFCQFKVK